MKQLKRGVRHGASLAGDLEVWPMTEIVRWLAESSRTGRLLVCDGGRQGCVDLHDGEICRCDLGFLGGEPALKCLLAIRHGVVSFVPLAAAKLERNVFHPTFDLLLRLA